MQTQHLTLTANLHKTFLNAKGFYKNHLYHPYRANYHVCFILRFYLIYFIFVEKNFADSRESINFALSISPLQLEGYVDVAYYCRLYGTVSFYSTLRAPF